MNQDIKYAKDAGRFEAQARYLRRDLKRLVEYIESGMDEVGLKAAANYARGALKLTEEHES